MNKQIDRLCFHLRMGTFSFQRKIFPFSLKKIMNQAKAIEFTTEEIDELKKLDKRLEQEHEEHICSEPVLVPQNTMYFGGGHNKKA